MGKAESRRKRGKGGRARETKPYAGQAKKRPNRLTNRSTNVRNIANRREEKPLDWEKERSLDLIAMCGEDALHGTRHDRNPGRGGEKRVPGPVHTAKKGLKLGWAITSRSLLIHLALGWTPRKGDGFRQEEGKGS